MKSWNDIISELNYLFLRFAFGEVYEMEPWGFGLEKVQNFFTRLQRLFNIYMPSFFCFVHTYWRFWSGFTDYLRVLSISTLVSANWHWWRLLLRPCYSKRFRYRILKPRLVHGHIKVNICQLLHVPCSLSGKSVKIWPIVHGDHLLKGFRHFTSPFDHDTPAFIELGNDAG